MSLPDFRIVYHASTKYGNGKAFRVDQRGLGARFMRVEYFTSVPAALKKFPGAEVSPMAQEERSRRERTKHAFVEPFDDSGMCRNCGGESAAAAHQLTHTGQPVGGAR